MKKERKTLISFLIFLTLWWLGSLVSKPLFLPSPLLVLETIIKNKKLFLQAMSVSFLRVTAATLLSILVSYLIGTLAICSKTIKEMVLPITKAFRFIPTTAFYPLLILWIGIGEQMKVSFLFLATFLFFLPTIIHEFLNVEQEKIELGVMLGFSKLKIIKKIILPSTLPNLSKSFLTMSAIGWTYCVVAETINTTKGLGYLMNIGSARGKTELVFGALSLIILINFLIDFIGMKIINKKFHWKKESEL